MTTTENVRAGCLGCLLLCLFFVPPLWPAEIALLLFYKYLIEQKEVKELLGIKT